MALTHITLWLTLATSAMGQRPFFAGTRPIGYPQVVVNRTTTSADGLADKFGEAVSTTTQRLPIEAQGDRDLVDRLSKLPIDKQPFWLINWQALEAHRENPQTYPQRPSHFAQPFDPNPNTGTANSNTASTGSNSASASSSSPISSTDSPNLNVNQSTPLDNRNGDPMITNQPKPSLVIFQEAYEIVKEMQMLIRNLSSQIKNVSTTTSPYDNNFGNPANGNSNSTNAKAEAHVSDINTAVNADGIASPKTGDSDSAPGNTNVTISPNSSHSNRNVGPTISTSTSSNPLSPNPDDDSSFDNSNEADDPPETEDDDIAK